MSDEVLPPEAHKPTVPEGDPLPLAASLRLHAVVRSLRRRALLVHGGAVLLGYLAFAALIVLIASLALGAGFGGWVRAVAFPLLAGGALAAAAMARFRLRALSVPRLTRSLEAADPRAAGLTTAVDLDARLAGDPPFSRDLARAHVEDAAVRAVAAPPAAAVPLVGARIPAAAMAASATLLLLAWLFVAPVRGGLPLLARAGPRSAEAAVRAAPITGDISLTYLYPAHTGLPSKTVEGTGGDITAPRGTQVLVKTRADRDLSSAFLESGGASLPMSVSGRQLSGTILVQASGTYDFRFADRGGDTLARGPEIPITAVEDAPPSVTIDAPIPELVVQQRDRVEVRWEASDDYGVARVELVYKVGEGEEKTVAVSSLPAPEKQASGSFIWELTPLALEPGDVVAYHVQAWDNDGVQGVKHGQSRTQTLKVFSPAEARRELLQKLQGIWDRMVAALGDRVAPRQGPQAVAPPQRVAAGKPADAEVKEASDSLSEAASALRKDRDSPADLRIATSNVAAALEEKGRATRLARGRAEQYGGTEMVRRLDDLEKTEQAELEKSVLYLESLLDRERLSELKSLAQELTSSRRELASLIEQFRTAPTDDVRAKIAQQVARLKARMSELMARMAELGKSIQDEHLNAEAMAELSKQNDMMSQLDQIQKMLAEGKVDDALKKLQELGMQMDKLADKIASAGRDQAGSDPALQKLAKDLDAYSKELGQLSEEQKKLAERTDAVKKQYRKEVEEELQKNGRDMVANLEKKIDKAKNELAKIPDADVPQHATEDLNGARERLEDLRHALDAKDFDAAMESAARAVSHAEGLEQSLKREAADAERYGYDDPEQSKNVAEQSARATPIVRDIEQDLQKIVPDPQKRMSQADRQKLQRLGQEQAQLSQRMGELKQKADAIQQQAPLFDEGAQKALSGAQGSMGQAEQRLRGSDAGGALASENAAGDQLQSLKDSLEEAKKRAQENGSGQGFPLPMASAGEGEGDGDGKGYRDEKVAIPSADQFKAPAEFRKDILDAMKQDAPESFKDQVKQYYQEIVK